VLLKLVSVAALLAVQSHCEDFLELRLLRLFILFVVKRRFKVALVPCDFFLDLEAPSYLHTCRSTRPVIS
jgi:hypothetical protein